MPRSLVYCILLSLGLPVAYYIVSFARCIAIELYLYNIIRQRPGAHIMIHPRVYWNFIIVTLSEVSGYHYNLVGRAWLEL